MQRIVTILLALGIGISGSYAVAANDMKKEPMADGKKMEAMAKPDMKQDNMKKADMKKDAMKQEAMMPKDDMGKGGMKK